MEYTLPIIHATGKTLTMLQEMFRTAMQECERCDIRYGKITDIKLNSRYSVWGLCKKQPDGTYHIELSKYLFENGASEDGIKNTLLHEICHTVPNGHGHKSGWLIAANKLNNMYGYQIHRTDSAERMGVSLDYKPAKYICHCKKCGQQFVRMKMSNLIQHPEQYRCKRCGGRIERDK